MRIEGKNLRDLTLLRCVHHIKSDIINNMDLMRIPGTEQLSVILSQTMKFKKWTLMLQKCQKQYIVKRDGAMNPQNNNFNQYNSENFDVGNTLLNPRHWSLKLTCHHINRRHFCFNIKSISVHPLLWMNVMLDFICMVFAGCAQRSVSKNFKMIMYASAGNRTRDPLLSSV